MPALVWLLLAAALLVGELFTLDLILLMLAAAALITTGVALGTDDLLAQLLVFGGSSIALLGVVRPVAKRHLTIGGTKDVPRALEGRPAVVVEAVTEGTGQVRVHGELWRARPYAGGPDLPAGTAVVVAQIEGATLHVYAHDPLQEEPLQEEPL